MASRKINDAEAAHTDTDSISPVMALIVGTAMDHALSHMRQGFMTRLPSRPQFADAVYSTHRVGEVLIVEGRIEVTALPPSEPQRSPSGVRARNFEFW